MTALKNTIIDEMGPSYDENGDEIVPTITNAQALAWWDQKCTKKLKALVRDDERQVQQKAALAAITVDDVEIT